MIEAHIDTATGKRDQVGTHVEIAGWAFAEQGHIMAVQAFGNGVALGFIPHGFCREDVLRHFQPRCSSEFVGFIGSLRLPGELAHASSLDLKLAFTSSSLEQRELAATVSMLAEEAGPEPLENAAPALDIADISATPQEALEAASAMARHGRLAAPNFFILGAAKCGTTGLHYSLAQHPEIHLSQPKEPCFFTTGFHVVSNPLEYFNLFPEQPGKKIYGEASHPNFSTAETAPVLRQLFPGAKFVLIVRNPVHRAHSLYQHMQRAGLEPIPTFELALKEENVRFSSRDFRERCPQYFWNYMYIRSSLYDVQFRNYLEHFPRDQFFVLTLGEWMSDPGHWQEAIFRFLEVDPGVRVGSEPQNQNPGPSAVREDTRALLEQRFAGLRERFEELVGRRLQHWEY